MLSFVSFFCTDQIYVVDGPELKALSTLELTVEPVCNGDLLAINNNGLGS